MNKIKLTSITFLAAILLLTPAMVNVNAGEPITKCIFRRIYDAQDIDLRDAAFHKSLDRRCGEWWYFEAIFDNGYSLLCGTAIASKKDEGSSILLINIYKDTELKYYLTKDVPLEEFEASEEYPLIKAFGKTVIELDWELYNQTGQWVYNVSIEIDGQIVDLTFEGATKGCKGEVLRGWYGPVLPRAIVNGTLTLDGEKITVSDGLGYHEHAWGISLPIWEWGWFWGKITSSNFTLCFAKMMLTRFWEQARAAVFSLEDSGEYININPRYYRLIATKYRFYNWRFIPTKFRVIINDPDNSIYIDVTLETINIHHLGERLVHYWRYHLKVNGEITYDSTTETIKNQIQIMEFIRFR